MNGSRSGERFQPETGQDDNCCDFFTSASPLFYTVNPRSGISLRQQEQLGAPSILKSFRDLPGCTRLSSSLSNLDSSSGYSRRGISQLPTLPNINNQKRSTSTNNMGKSLQGHPHHSSSKRLVRERDRDRERYSHNPPFKVNAKIRTVYTQEVTTIESQSQEPSEPSKSSSATITCHRQTQTEPLTLFSGLEKQDEATSRFKRYPALRKNAPGDENAENAEMEDLGEVESSSEETPSSQRVDASTSPIPPLNFLGLGTSSDSGTSSGGGPFSGCSQMTVYPPLNYVRKLEDLEKITGHIVIQRFFTRTDDAFGSWLEKQLGMTSKSVSVDTSEFENAKTAELQDDQEENENDATEPLITKTQVSGTDAQESEKDQDEDQEDASAVDKENDDDNCALADSIKCECYLEKVPDTDDCDYDDSGVEQETEVVTTEAEADKNETLDEIEEQIIVEGGNSEIGEDEDVVQNDEKSKIKLPIVATAVSAAQTLSKTKNEEAPPPGEKSITKLPTVATAISAAQTIDKMAKDSKGQEEKGNEEEDIDEVVRCTLEAYLMAPMAFEEENDENDGVEKTGDENVSPGLNEIDSGRADSIQSQEKASMDEVEVEGTTSHDSVETVYEMPASEFKTDSPAETIQRSLSADSCIGTESSGDVKNATTNASQSSNDTIQDLVEPSLASPVITKTKLPTVATAISAAQALTLVRSLSSAKSQRSLSPPPSGGQGGDGDDDATGIDKTDHDHDQEEEADDADGESETESEIIDNDNDNVQLTAKLINNNGTDLELEEVEEDDDDDERDAFDTMVENHLKYSRGLSTGGIRGRSRLLNNRGTQTTKSIEPSTSSGSISPCSSSNSSFDVEIISKSKRITTTATTASSSAGGGGGNYFQDRDIAPCNRSSNMTLAWHEGGRRRSYLPSSSSSLNLLNMKFSLGRDFESEVSIRMPAANPPPPPKSSATSAASAGTSLLLPPGSGSSKPPLMSRSHHHHYFPNRGFSPGFHHHHPLQSPDRENLSARETDLQSLWKDVRSKLDSQVDEMVGTPEEEMNGGGAVGTGSGGGGGGRPPLHVRGSGILPTSAESQQSQSHPHQVSSAPGFPGGVKLKRNEERIKKSLQKLKKILED